MNTDPNQPKGAKQPEDGNEQDLNLTNSDATLTHHGVKQPDAPSLSDQADTATSENLTQSITTGSEINPEYGDAEDPTFETL